jgi:hypothetical protein
MWGLIYVEYKVITSDMNCGDVGSCLELMGCQIK